MRRAPLAVLALVLTAAPSATAASLPGVKSGQRPGPPLLYAPAPDAPQLSLQAPFAAPPLLVSGTDAYRGGEYLYQDYLFDDRGANTVAASGTRSSPGSDIASPTAGEARYPTGDAYAGNAADLVELRVKPTATEVVYRVTLNTVKSDTAAVVGIGIDSDGGVPVPVAWPGGAGLTTPGLDRFITAWGTGGEVTSLPTGGAEKLPAGAVSIDRTTNQMTIRVPRSVMDPGRSKWRVVAGVGLFSGDESPGARRFKALRKGTDPTAEEPSTGSSAAVQPDVSPVFNLAFRFNEPQGSSPTPRYDTFPGVGNWFEDEQARLLRDGNTGESGADIDFGKLADGASEDLHQTQGREQARIFASGLDLPEGVGSKFPKYGGQLQPYLITVPPGYRQGKATGLTFSLHSLGGTYTQYKVFSPNQLRQFGDERENVVVTPLGRGTDGWYTDEAEADFFEVWADVARNFTLDSERVALSGYSMGGYGTYKLGTQYPDLFGRGFTTVGPPGRGIWLPPNPPSDGQFTLSNLVLENVRSVPFLNWVAGQDQLVPLPGPVAQQRRFDELGLRSSLRIFEGGEHFTLALLDRWDEARDFLGDTRVTRDPSRVDYAFLPAADRPKLGLVHDHAYWVSKLRAREADGDPRTAPSRAEISARSFALGEGDPVTKPVTGASPSGAAGPPLASTITGTEWTSVGSVPRRNRLELDLENIRSGSINAVRARLKPRRPLLIRVTSDGAGKMRLNIKLPRRTRVRRVQGQPVVRPRPGRRRAPEVRKFRGALRFTVAAGTREYLITPPRKRGR